MFCPQLPTDMHAWNLPPVSFPRVCSADLDCTLPDPVECVDDEGNEYMKRGHKPIARFSAEAFLHTNAAAFDLDNQIKSGCIPTEVPSVKPSTMDAMSVAFAAAAPAIQVIENNAANIAAHSTHNKVNE